MPPKAGVRKQKRNGTSSKAARGKPARKSVLALDDDAEVSGAALRKALADEVSSAVLLFQQACSYTELRKWLENLGRLA